MDSIESKQEEKVSCSPPVQWDIFISYASEDGDAVAHPLAQLLL